MPKELVALAPSQPVLRDYEERKPKENEILVRTQFSAAKHGTESFLFHGNAPAGDKRYDPDWHMFVERDQPRARYQRSRPGNCGASETARAGSVSLSHLPCCAA